MKFICCSSALCVCFWLGRPLGFFCVLFSLFTNPLYPNCAVLNISRHAAKVTQHSWRKRAKHLVLSGVMALGCLVAPFHRVEMCEHSHVSLHSQWRRAASAETWCSSGRESCSAHTSRVQLSPGSPPETTSLRPCLLLAQTFS